MADTTTKNLNKHLILRPVISEKSTGFAEFGKYIFLVRPESTQSEIKKAVERQYGVHVVKTNVVMQKPKPKHFGRSIRLVSRPKKVIVTLKKGEKLDILPQ